MNSSRLHYSPEAAQDLENIRDYVMLEFSNPEAALRIVDQIMNAADNLVSFPKLGATLASITGIASPYRFIVAGKYMVFYRVEGEDVYIDRILYGKRDYFRVLFEDQEENLWSDSQRT